MKKTKIVCTIGPSSAKKSIIERMIKSGMNVARINLSHVNKKTFKSHMNMIRSVDAKIPIIADLRGPEVRIIGLKKPLKIVKNQIIKISGDEGKFLKVSYKNIHRDIKKKSLILLDEGLIKLRVLEIKNKIIYCKALNSNILNNNKKVTIPGSNLKLKFINKSDKQDINFSIKNKIEFLAPSFVKSKRDVQEIRKLIGSNLTRIITKIETAEAVNNFGEILEVSDGIMIARGDLGVELPPENVPIIQKNIIKECIQVGKPVITATQMLESMISNASPTRAETADVANAILDGTDAIMLSGESAIGKFPVDSVKTMTKISRKVEFMVQNRMEKPHKSISEEISFAVYNLSKSNIINKIITSTGSGFTTRMISRFRPQKLLIAITRDKMTRNQLVLSWSVIPIFLSEKFLQDEDLAHRFIKYCYKIKLLNKNDTVVITASIAGKGPGHTNLIEIHKVKDLL